MRNDELKTAFNSSFITPHSALGVFKWHIRRA
jgi:hypothetical protein